MQMSSSDENIFGQIKECLFLGEDRGSAGSVAPESEETLYEYVFKDQLTGLANRNMLLKDIEANSSPVLYLISINDFGELNDAFGLVAGDGAIVALSKFLGATVDPATSKLYRMTGGDFALLKNTVKEQTHWPALEAVAREITQSVRREDFTIGTSRSGESLCSLRLHVTIGIAVSGVVGKDNLIAWADIALKTAKNRNKPYLFYKQSIQTSKYYKNNRFWTQKLHGALERDSIIPFFQPIMNNHNGRIEKYESLVRLVDEDNEAFPPVHFLSLAKITKLYPEITRRMVKKTFAAFKDKKHGVSINLNYFDILDGENKELIFEMIDSYPDVDVSFEILESEAIKNFARVALFSDAVKELGGKIGIDDFGIGYSNFYYLIDLDVDFLKIDASLIKSLHADRNSQVIARSIVGFAKELHIKTIAEHVHSRAVFEKVKEIGFDYSQGDYIGKPSADMPDSKIT